MKPTLFLSLVLLTTSLVRGQTPWENQLESSPRHHEWVTLEVGDRPVRAFLAFPESDEKALSIVVIHENRGLNSWARSVADKLAEAGYIAIAPDLLSGEGPGGGGTDAFESSDDARSAIYGLHPARVTADLKAVANYVKALPAADGRVAVAGFCWGGSQTFRFATNYEDLETAFVFYGSGPDSAAVAQIDAPVYGFYGQEDERVNATIEGTAEAMAAAGQTFEPVVYDGAQHAFMRRGETAESPEDHNRKAMGAAWQRWISILEEL